MSKSSGKKNLSLVLSNLVSIYFPNFFFYEQKGPQGCEFYHWQDGPNNYVEYLVSIGIFVHASGAVIRGVQAGEVQPIESL